MKEQTKWIASTYFLLALLYIALNAPALYATGLLVFDASSFATIGKIWSTDVSNGVKLLNTYNEAVKITKNGLDIYNLATAMAQRVQSKQVWETVAFAMGNGITQTHYNESINMSAVMNGDVLNAGTAWHQATLQSGTPTYMGFSIPGNSKRAADYATIQLFDQTSARCAEVLANYKSKQDANQGAEDKLKTDTLDTSDAKNSMIAGLNVLAGGRLHLQTQQRANGNVQACLAEQQTMEAKWRRDQLAYQSIWYNDIATARASTPSTLDPTKTAGANQYLLP